MRRLKNRYGVSPVPAARPALGAAGEREHAEALEEEIALLGEEQVEPRQVDLLLVDLDLREVGVEGEVGGEVLGDAVLRRSPPTRVVDVVRRAAASTVRSVVTPPSA